MTFARRPAARGKRRRLRAAKPRRTWLETDEVAVLVKAAAEHRALIATMVLAGLKVSEMTGLRWRDVDLAGRRLRVAESKTDAGVRTVDLSPWLAEELATHRASARFTGPADYVFAKRNGTRRQRSNVTRQILGPAIEAANQRLRREGRPTRRARRPPTSWRRWATRARRSRSRCTPARWSGSGTPGRGWTRSSGPPIGHQWAPAPIPSPRLQTAGM